MTSTEVRPLKIAFLHPVLGIGGAERLIVDAALGLQQLGHHVSIYTTEHNIAHSFEQTHNGQLDIRVRGSFIPLHIGNRLRAPCTILRMFYLSVAVIKELRECDIVICDLVAHPLLLLRRICSAKILFYCHFPDRLLASKGNRVYQIYRKPIDKLEQLGMLSADKIITNSRFTADVVSRVFSGLELSASDVLHPGVETNDYAAIATLNLNSQLFVSINRFDPAKNLKLAIHALVILRERISSDLFKNIRFIFAGSCDRRLREQRQELIELKQLRRRYKLTKQIKFLEHCDEQQRYELLQKCLGIIYTPSDEHFGIVPIEAMAAARPVIATNTGGPLETVVHGETGILCSATAESFADAMLQLLSKPKEAKNMGLAGRERVKNNFSLSIFNQRLNMLVQKLAGD